MNHTSIASWLKVKIVEIDIHSLRYFVERWHIKAQNVSSHEDFPFVDRFIYAYIAFNALYSAAANIMNGSNIINSWNYQRGGLPRGKFRTFQSEKLQATILVENFAGKMPYLWYFIHFEMRFKLYVSALLRVCFISMKMKLENQT